MSSISTCLMHFVAGSLFIGMLAAGPTFAQETALPYPPALQCQSCHRPAGESADAIPPIDVANEERLHRQLLDFKYGHLPATIMDRIARGYSDEELAKIAAHFAAQAGEGNE